jgi:hypothetical protein
MRDDMGKGVEDFSNEAIKPQKLSLRGGGSLRHTGGPRARETPISKAKDCLSRPLFHSAVVAGCGSGAVVDDSHNRANAVVAVN